MDTAGLTSLKLFQSVPLVMKNIAPYKGPANIVNTWVKIAIPKDAKALLALDGLTFLTTLCNVLMAFVKTRPPNISTGRYLHQPESQVVTLQFIHSFAPMFTSILTIILQIHAP